MKIFIKPIVLLIVFGIALSGNAQQRANDRRTNETKIVDIVMQLPAKDAETQNRLMQELIRLNDVVPNLASKLLPAGQGNDSQVRAAINGLALYALQENDPSGKKKIIDELTMAITSAKSNDIKEFLLTQKQYLTGEKEVPHSNQFSNTPEQKLLSLRDALETARTPAQKEEIIKQIAQTGTFLGLISAGKYLDDTFLAGRQYSYNRLIVDGDYLNDINANVQQAAVQTVITIALAHPEYYGKVVTDLLNKAMKLNKSPKAISQKQAVLKHLATFPKDEGFVSMFNGKDLTGWKGLVENPIARSKMTPAELAQKQVKADEVMRRDWKVEAGLLVYEGAGFDNICSTKKYGDIEMYVDWKIAPEGDAGIYLRGSPQVQIWDTSRTNVGAQVGSGGLYNNQKYQSNPLVVADNPVNEWNSFYIRMEGDKVTVYLNGQLVVDHIILENYWDRSLPIFPEEAVELQAHGSRVEYRDIYVRDIPQPKAYEVSKIEKNEGFVPMFNGVDLTGWVGDMNGYYVKDGMLICKKETNDKLCTQKEYADFIVRFEFQLTPAANNGLGVRTPLEGDAAYAGMELQILDDNAEVYKDLHDYQYHGSVYGVIPAKRGFLKPVGEWNHQEVIAKGNRITITLNGTVILDGDIAEASKNFTSTIDGNKHPGLSNRQGHICLLGHASQVNFRNMRIKELK